jgi:NAD(P)-dependent dehydrogenase (short-subunit alcohol dehydrogenase family)
MAGRLEGKVAVVTGAGRGIGRGIALLMAKEGARVVVADNGSAIDGSGSSARPAQQVVEEISERRGQALADYGDVSSWNDAERMVKKAIDAWGKLDILVTAAGNWRRGTVADLGEKDWDEVIRVHLRGTYATAHFAAKHWVQRREYGRLITFTSGAGIRGLPTMVSYSTAKAGIIGLTKAIANSLVSYKVTANCIAPGAATRMMDAALDRSYETFKRTGKWPSESARGSELDPNAIAPLAVYLASDAASHVSGRVFGARGNQYALFSELTEIRNLPGPWNEQGVDRVFKEAPGALTQDLSLSELPFPMESVDLKHWDTLPPDN